MSILDRFKGNPLEKMKTRELRSEEIRLKNRVDQIRKEINKNEKEKKKLFGQGVGADPIKKKMLAQDMKGLDMEAKLKLKNFSTARRQLMFTKNLLIIKNYEKDLKNTAVWKKITSIPKENLESFLINVRLEGKEFDEVLDQLNQPFEMEVADFDDEEMKEDEKKLFDAWDQVEGGSMEVGDIDSIISINRELEKEEED